MFYWTTAYRVVVQRCAEERILAVAVLVTSAIVGNTGRGCTLYSFRCHKISKNIRVCNRPRKHVITLRANSASKQMS